MKRTIVKTATVGDAAVDGLLGGVLAGAAMTIYLVGVSLFGGEGVAVLARFDPNNASPVIGALMHLAVSGVYGAAFGILFNWMRRFNLPAWLSGLAFGLALFALAVTIILPSSRSALAEIPVERLGIAHVIYGLVVGTIVGRSLRAI